MSGKRTYGDACGIARALDVLGERWALMIVRELLLGPKRFTDLRSGLPHVSADVLSQRLRGLEAAGIVERRTLPPPAPAKVYDLTPSGRDIEPVLIELGRWGGTHTPSAPEECGMSLDSHIVSMRTLFDPELARGFEARVQLDVDGHPFRAEVSGRKLEIERGTDPAPEATIRVGPRTLIDVLHGHRELGEVMAAGDLEIEGDEAVAARLLTLCPLPAAGVEPVDPVAG